MNLCFNQSFWTSNSQLRQNETMKITNHSAINNILFSIESEGMHIVFDKVSIQSFTGNLSLWINGVFTGMIGRSKAQEALKIMNELVLPELPKQEMQTTYKKKVIL